MVEVRHRRPSLRVTIRLLRLTASSSNNSLASIASYNPHADGSTDDGRHLHDGLYG